MDAIVWTDSIIARSIAQGNHSVMVWIDGYFWPVLSFVVFLGAVIGMAPILTHHTQSFREFLCVYARRALLAGVIGLLGLHLTSAVLYHVGAESSGAATGRAYAAWALQLAERQWYLVLIALGLGLGLRFLFHRYVTTWCSRLLRKLRRQQTTETGSDIRRPEPGAKQQHYRPADHYRDEQIFVGLHEQEPIYIPEATWNEVNMQIIGPTRCGKGVLLGCLMDQMIRRGNTVFYIDPKPDRFAPHIMYQASQAAGRKFYYVSLNDHGPGRWAPFAGGTQRDALARLEVAFGLEYTGNPGTDFYKGQERVVVERGFRHTRTLKGLASFLRGDGGTKERALRVRAELERWSSLSSLCPTPGRGFRIAQALLDNAVVYVQGSLSDSIVKTATKVFIIEVIQEVMRLEKERQSHVTLLVDEVRFLVSRQLADALATALGFRSNIVTAYQSVQDLMTPDDATIHGGALLRSVNVNSQVKAIYGGADFDTAKWVADLSGTILKEVTRSERTEIKSGGAEIWEQQRIVGSQEENLIAKNSVLSLPPRVCAFVQPQQLATTCATAWVPIESNEPLEQYLARGEQKAAKREKPKTSETGKDPVAA